MDKCVAAQDIINLDDADLQQLMWSGKVIEGSKEQPRVIFDQHNDVIKFFYARKKKAFYSSSRRDPYALRFRRNAEKLQALGFICPKVDALYHAANKDTYALKYSLMPGEDLRALMARDETSLFYALAQYLSELHVKGVYFRAIHLGNLLQSNEHELALLDICDVYFKASPLHWYYRARNLSHLIYYDAQDTALFQQFGIQRFLQLYLEIVQLSPCSRRLFEWFMARQSADL